ncbi:MAG: glycine cleavage system protein GcvH [Bacilli bacterium]|nr:glycine cleavage system protein GcvH [Bacilli bacterium]
MFKVLENLKYSKTHEWVSVSDGVGTVGITDFAQHSLGTIVYVEGYEPGEEVSQGGECGAVESVKAASDIMAPVSGEVLEVNEEVLNNPELLNDDPYTNWILKIKLSDEDELNALLDAKDYEKEQK